MDRAGYTRFEPLEARRLLAGDSVLFIRGATRSGGFYEATNDFQRTEQLADINGADTWRGNHGWATLAQTLRDQGFAVSQMIEPLETGAPSSGQTTGSPIDLTSINLGQYSVLVFASNNAAYSTASVNAFVDYVRAGGAALFISDANFGAHWRDAPDSDQPFLARFGVTVNQDEGAYTLERAAGHFVQPDHPLFGDVDIIDGEGVSPFVLGTAPDGVRLTRLAAARNQTRNNNGASAANLYQGTLRSVTASDASIFTATLGDGRIVGHFDRNTFFNINGAGTDITRYDNRQYALNLFDWLAHADTAPPRCTAASFTQGVPHELTLSFNDNLAGSLGRGDIILKDRVTGVRLSPTRWSLLISETDQWTDVTIRIKSAIPPGKYQLLIHQGRISDDAGNASESRVSFKFTILPPPAPIPVVAAARFASAASSLWALIDAQDR